MKPNQRAEPPQMTEYDHMTLMAALTRCGVYTMKRPFTACRILAGKVNKVCARNDQLSREVLDQARLIDALLYENAFLNRENVALARNHDSSSGAINIRQKGITQQ